MEKTNKFTVATQCMTYNQVSFIKKTLNGFVIQKTSFPMVFIVVDDASTDGEQDVLKKWANDNLNFTYEDAYNRETDYARIIYAPHKDNSNMFFVILLLHENLYNKPIRKLSYISEWSDNSKYIALCEGDDYWTDPLKLQMQVDFLERHGDYSLTCHRYDIFDYENNTFISDGNSFLFQDKDGISFGLNYKVWLAKTLSLVFRRDAMDEFSRRATSNMRDTVLVYFLLKQGKAYCFNKVMGVYALHFGSTCGKKSVSENRVTAYEVSRYIYLIDKDKYARKRYYRNYMYALYFTKGKLLFDEKFDLIKFLSVPFFFLKEIADSIYYRIRIKGRAN